MNEYSSRQNNDEINENMRYKSQQTYERIHKKMNEWMVVREYPDIELLLTNISHKAWEKA